MHGQSIQERALRIQERLDVLAQITDAPGTIFRSFLSPAMGRANHQVEIWMREAGLESEQDVMGNLFGSEEGKQKAKDKTQDEKEEKGKPVLILGSHLDTVPNAGRFDGPLGVLLAIEAFAHLAPIRDALRWEIEVASFADEEGVRFHKAYLGSLARCGALQESDLSLCDDAGICLRDAIEMLSQIPFDLSSLRRIPQNLAGYLEVHIEQGPILEQEGLPVGVVTGIAGQRRSRLIWEGKAAHAGTTPVSQRRDALLGASAFISGVAAAMERFPGLRATVGNLTVEPNASNVVPGRVIHSLDVRHPDEAILRQADQFLEEEAKSLATAHRLSLFWEIVQHSSAVLCDQEMRANLMQSVSRVAGRALELSSGAGHDAAVMARVGPIAMLFVRCKEGVSHHPDEFTSREDIEVALAVLVDFLESGRER